MEENKLKEIAKLLRYYILISTTKAGSGHPTSSLSLVEILTSLFFDGFFNFDFNDPKNFLNDRLILSKGHASPLLYSLYTVLGIINEDQLLSLRKFSSSLQGHPIPDKFLIDVATGSLGQGLSIGVGMALGIKLRINNLNKKDQKLRINQVPKIWVLLGDGEMAEGQVWEAIQIASYYNLNNLVGIIDINRLGQKGETMVGWDLEVYKKRIESFGWETILVNDGHSFDELRKAYSQVIQKQNKPTMILTKTIKGKGISFLENKDGWHGKVLNEDQLELALKEIGFINKNIIKKVSFFDLKIEDNKNDNSLNFVFSNYSKEELISTRQAYGESLLKLGEINENTLVLDAGVSNSTYAEIFKDKFPERFFEMFIAEQNMISVALGLSKMGFVPFASSFSAFLTRVFDQIRMAQYSFANIKIAGSHAGVSIGEDGPSQMGLEDLAMMRSILNSVVLYPADAVATQKLVFESAKYNGLVYLRTTRKETPVIYDPQEEFFIGGSKVHRLTEERSRFLIVGAGITLFEALKAQKKLSEEKINTVVLDCYSVKPLDKKTILGLTKEVEAVIIVEDHYPTGGLGEAITSLLSKDKKPIYHLCVKKFPRSGKPKELLKYESIDSQSIIDLIKRL